MPKPTSRSKPAIDIHPRLPNWTYQDSRFWKEIRSAANPALEAVTKELVSAAVELAGRIATELPTFTRHDRVHLDNVLYWMDSFVTEAGLKELGPVGSALCILLAYVHDLGMLPEQGWRKRLKSEGSEDARRLRLWATEHHADLVDLAERCRKGNEEQQQRAEWIDGFIQLDYLRATHAEEGVDGRISSHLNTLAEHNSLKDAFGFLAARDQAVGLFSMMVASHGSSVDWLARELERKNRPYCQDGRDGRANLVLPALLLRLADICDFDSSRTPPILFHQLGLEGLIPLGLDHTAPTDLPKEQARASSITAREWMKHLAVDRWHWETTGRLCFVASDCPHPAVERSIRHFCIEIEREVTGIRAELKRVFPEEGDAWVCLPDKIEPVIAPRDYHYEDISFHLQAHEVTKLLMGTALYGNPELCIRELLQNALDAVQLRDLRWRLKQKLEQQGERTPPWAEPVDPWTPEERRCPIRLEWGKDETTGREWISVRDAGTGMKLDQIRRYLCALGRSYYRSPELNAETLFMREHGLFATPISQFGIGILSCFMIAEWMEVRTCPCGKDDEKRQAWNVKIAGPGSLFHFTKKNCRQRPGTEVRLYLKPGFRVVDMTREDLLGQLRAEFGYGGNRVPKEGTRAGVTYFNPAAVAARHVVWPRYPIQAGGQGSAEPLEINDGWHFKDLHPLDCERLSQQAQEWHLPPSHVEGAQWRPLDWVDDQFGAASTGSRIRVVIPTNSRNAETLLPPWSLLTLVESQLSETPARSRRLVRGMNVENWDDVPDFSRPFPVQGMWIWVDFAGPASPRLTADRKGAYVPSDVSEQWVQSIRGLFERWAEAQAQILPPDSPARASFVQGIRLSSDLRRKFSRHGSGRPWRLSAIWPEQECTCLSDCAALVATSLLLEQTPRPTAFREEEARDQDLSFALDETLTPSHQRSQMHQLFDPPCAHKTARSLVRAHRQILKSKQALDFVRDLALGQANDRTQTFTRSGEHQMAMEHLDALFEALIGFQLSSPLTLGRALSSAVECHFINEGFWPSPSEAFPPLQLPDGVIADATHLGPAVLWWGEGAKPVEAATKLASWDYDLVLPFSVIATPTWRKRFPSWERERHWRSLLTLPFFFPSPELARKIADVLRASPLARDQALPISDLRVLIPRPELWDKTFNEWTEDDSASCGYSAQWDLATGEMRWAVGAIRRDEMSKVGKSWDAFLESDELRRYKELCPESFQELNNQQSPSAS